MTSLPNKFRYETNSQGTKVLVTITPENPDYHTEHESTLKYKLTQAFSFPIAIYYCLTGKIMNH